MSTHLQNQIDNNAECIKRLSLLIAATNPGMEPAISDLMDDWAAANKLARMEQDTGYTPPTAA